MAAENTGPQIAVEWTVADASRILVAPHATDNKYSRGVLAIVTGSVRYPGAAVLGVEAALRSGPGMVRFVGPDPVTHLVLARRPEIVPGPGRAQAILIGSGMDRDEAVLRWDQSVAATPPSASVPVVLDAGGITLLGRRLRLKAVTTGAGTEGDAAGEPPVVITPHAGELAALLDVDRAGVEADPVAAAVRAAARWNCVVVLKGSTTVVATPSGRARTVPVTTHWLASAGTGDVLAGCLAALVATAAARGALTNNTLAGVAATAALIHATAAVQASSGGPLVALELATGLSRALASLLGH